MKKIILLALVALLTGRWCMAQDENNLKNFRFGLKFAPSINWMRPDDKKLSKAGSALGLKYGLMMEFRLNGVASFATGIEGSHLGGKVTFKDSAVYRVQDDAFVDVGDTAGTGSTKSSYLLNGTRTYRTTYVTVPLTLKLKTKDIGGMTYFGVFGGDLNFRVGAKATDEKITNLQVANGTSFDPTKVDNGKDMNIMTVNLNAGAGIEYNVSGSTSLVASLHYNRGFMSATKAKSEFLAKGKHSVDPYSQKAFTDGLVISLGVLF